MFFVKKEQGILMNNIFGAQPPMPQATWWANLLEATPTRMPICDFVIMRTPTTQEITDLTPRILTIQKAV